MTWIKSLLTIALTACSFSLQAEMVSVTFDAKYAHAYGTHEVTTQGNPAAPWQGQDIRVDDRPASEKRNVPILRGGSTTSTLTSPILTQPVSQISLVVVAGTTHTKSKVAHLSVCGQPLPETAISDDPTTITYTFASPISINDTLTIENTHTSIDNKVAILSVAYGIPDSTITTEIQGLSSERHSTAETLTLTAPVEPYFAPRYTWELAQSIGTDGDWQTISTSPSCTITCANYAPKLYYTIRVTIATNQGEPLVCKALFYLFEQPTATAFAADALSYTSANASWAFDKDQPQHLILDTAQVPTALDVRPESVLNPQVAHLASDTLIPLDLPASWDGGELRIEIVHRDGESFACTQIRYKTSENGLTNQIVPEQPTTLIAIPIKCYTATKRISLQVDCDKATLDQLDVRVTHMTEEAGAYTSQPATGTAATLTQLMPGTTYYTRLWDATNHAPASPVISFTTPELLPPTRIYRDRTGNISWEPIPGTQTHVSAYIPEPNPALPTTLAITGICKSNLKLVRVTNFTDQPIDLIDYAIRKYESTDATTTDIWLKGSLEPGASMTFGKAWSTATLPEGVTQANFGFNGEDDIALIRGEGELIRAKVSCPDKSLITLTDGTFTFAEAIPFDPIKDSASALVKPFAYSPTLNEPLNKWLCEATPSIQANKLDNATYLKFISLFAGHNSPTFTWVEIDTLPPPPSPTQRGLQIYLK